MHFHKGVFQAMITDYAKCYGCGACVCACPKQCISMVSNDEGFLYPSIDSSACIHCQKCSVVCPINNDLPKTNYFAVYAAVNKNADERNISSSGGVFLPLAKWIIHSGGIVFGAAFDDAFELEHTYAETEEELKKFCGSKYLQSNLRHSFSDVEKFLLQGKTILFVGTPCQVAGLKKYLGKDYEGLYTVDFICHGVPSPTLWKKYVRSLHSGKPKDISFRDKSSGWKDYSVRINFEKKDYFCPNTKDRFMELFISEYPLRESCFSCAFKDHKSAGDLTLGDFWGVDSIFPNLDDDKGVSLVLVNTEKGCALFDHISDQITRIETTYAQAVSRNKSAFTRPQRNSRRDLYLKSIKKKSFDYIYKYCYYPTRKERFHTMIAKMLKR